MVKRDNYEKSSTKRNVLSDKEVDKLLNVLETPEERFVVKGLLYTGLRGGAFLHMQQSWIDFDYGVIRVPLSQRCTTCKKCVEPRHNKKGDIIKQVNTWIPKTEASARTIPIVPEIRKEMEWFFLETGHKKVMDVYKWRQYLYNIVRDAGKRARIDHPVFPHALRGTFATILASKDFDIYEVKDVLGWSSIQPSIFYINLAGARIKKSFKEKW